MYSRKLLKKILAARNQRMLAQLLIQYVEEQLQTDRIYIFHQRRKSKQSHILYGNSPSHSIALFSELFWSWSSQFDMSDGLIPIVLNTDHKSRFGQQSEMSYMLVLDNHPDKRTYLVVENIATGLEQGISPRVEIEVLHMFAARWQCVRAESEVAKQFKERGIKEAQYLDVIQQREHFIDHMRLVQQAAVEISNPYDLDAFYRMAVETVRNKLGFDRAAFMLLDIKKRCFSGTYGTDEQGKTVSEHHTQYDLHLLEEKYVDALFEGNANLIIDEDAPLYTAGVVVGQGWNGMLILRDGDEIIGWLALDNFIQRDPVTTYQKQMLEAFGALLSQIYIRKRQEQNVRMLHASMVELSRCLTVSDVCKSAVTFAITKLGIDRFAVFLTDENCTYMQGTWGTDVEGNVVDESYYHSDTVNRDIVNSARINPNDVVFEESVPIYHDFQAVGFGWTAMTLLVDQNGVPIAFIAADNLLKRTPLTLQLREVIRMFASNITEVLLRVKAQEAIHELNEHLEREVKIRTHELQKANERLELMAKMDPLTRLGNRRMFEALLEDVCLEPQSRRNHYGLILVDLDHFGLYNNHYGHMQGDIALMRVGSILQHHTQSVSEVFCRIGGEEFALLVSNQDESRVAQLAESVRRSIENEKIPHKLNTSSQYLTASVGYVVKELERKNFNFDDLYEEADKALYKAKENGRNKVAGAACLLGYTR